MAKHVLRLLFALHWFCYVLLGITMLWLSIVLTLWLPMNLLVDALFLLGFLVGMASVLFGGWLYIERTVSTRIITPPPTTRSTHYWQPKAEHWISDPPGTLEDEDAAHPWQRNRVLRPGCVQPPTLQEKRARRQRREQPRREPKIIVLPMSHAQHAKDAQTHTNKGA